MTLLSKFLFSPDAFKTSEDLFSHLQYERRGFSGTSDPNLNGLYLDIQKGVLDQLLHKNVLKRVSNTELYGKITNFPFAIIYPQIDNNPRHPSQLYEAFFEGIVLFIILFFYFNRKPEQYQIGKISALFLIIYSVCVY